MRTSWCECQTPLLFGGELAGAGAGGGLWRLDAAAAKANAVGGYYANPEDKAFGSHDYYGTSSSSSFSSSSSSSPAAASTASANASSSSSSVSSPAVSSPPPHWRHVRLVGVGPDGVPSPRRDATLAGTFIHTNHHGESRA